MFVNMTDKARTPKVAISSSQRAVRVPRKKIARLVAFLGRAEGVRIAEVDVAVVDRDGIAALNRRYLARAGATDVLSFDLSDSAAEGIVAQLVVCGVAAAAQAAARGVGVQRELLLYVTHGLLHLTGYDDGTARGAARMHAREEEILDAFLARYKR